MIRAIQFPFWNSNQREIKRPPLRQIERLRLTPKRDGDVFREPMKFSLRRLPLHPLNIFHIHYAHHRCHFFGSFCFSFSTDAKRSPCFLTRSTVFSQRNLSRSAFFFFRQLATSSQVTGVETVGSSLARNE